MDQLVPTFPWMPGPTVTPLAEEMEIPEVGGSNMLLKKFALVWPCLVFQETLVAFRTFMFFRVDYFRSDRVFGKF